MHSWCIDALEQRQRCSPLVCTHMQARFSAHTVFFALISSKLCWSASCCLSVIVHHLSACLFIEIFGPQFHIKLALFFFLKWRDLCCKVRVCSYQSFHTLKWISAIEKENKFWVLDHPGGGVPTLPIIFRLTFYALVFPMCNMGSVFFNHLNFFVLCELYFRIVWGMLFNATII